MHVTSPGPRRRERLRALAFVTALIWIVGAPFYTQLLHPRVPLYAWDMFGKRGLDLVELRLERVAAAGPREPVERTRVLGYARPWDAPRERRRIVGEDGLHRAVAELCTRLGPGTDLRVHARLAIAGGDGWRVLDDGAKNACPGASR
jgi:hypothetical protein